tara:strand:+ start:844 stop:1290 length:447 start_codon:yes stop_codon:yes gene_type:complete
MKTGYKVCDAMTKKPIMVLPTTSIIECAKIMSANHVGSLLISEEKKILGLITEQDIVRKAVAQHNNLHKSKVEDHMEKRLHTIGPEVDIFDAIKMMGEHNIRHLPVMDDEEMLGFVTLKDILKIQPELFELMVDKIELREIENKPVDL